MTSRTLARTQLSDGSTALRRFEDLARLHDLVFGTDDAGEILWSSRPLDELLEGRRLGSGRRFLKAVDGGARDPRASRRLEIRGNNGTALPLHGSVVPLPTDDASGLFAVIARPSAESDAGAHETAAHDRSSR